MEGRDKGVSQLDMINAEKFLEKYFDCTLEGLDSLLLNFEKKELCHLLAVFSQELEFRPIDDRGNLTLIILNKKD